METLKSIKSLIKNSKGLDLAQILYKLEKDHKYSIPEKIKEDIDLINKKWNQKERSDYFKNQDNLCITHLKVKDKKIYLNFCDEKYIQRQVFSECLSVLSDLEKDLVLSDINEKKIKIPLAYKIFITVITKDNKILLSKRSSKVAYNKNKTDISLSKAVKPEDMTGKSFQIHNTIFRALRDDLNMELKMDDLIKENLIKINDFFINKENFSVVADITIDFSKSKTMNITEEEILKKIKSAKNSWKFSEFSFLKNDEKTIKKELKKLKEKLTNYSLKKILDIGDIKPE